MKSVQLRFSPASEGLAEHQVVEVGVPRLTRRLENPVSECRAKLLPASMPSDGSQMTELPEVLYCCLPDRVLRLRACAPGFTLASFSP